MRPILLLSLELYNNQAVSQTDHEIRIEIAEKLAKISEEANNPFFRPFVTKASDLVERANEEFNYLDVEKLEEIKNIFIYVESTLSSVEEIMAICTDEILQGYYDELLAIQERTNG